MTTTTATYFRFGALPDNADSCGYRVSRNHRDDYNEEGVSLYAGWLADDGTVTLDLRGVDAFSALFIIDAGKPLYRVEGTILAVTGADGEPLLLTDDWSDTEDGWMMPASHHPVTLTRMHGEVRTMLSEVAA